MCGYFCIGFIDFMLEGKSMLEYTNLFSLNDYEKNDKIIKSLKYHIFAIKHYLFQVFVTNAEVKMKNQLKY